MRVASVIVLLVSAVVAAPVNQLWACGSHNHGQLGIGSGGGIHNTPRLVTDFWTGDIATDDISAGDFNSLAITSTGAVYTWGLGEVTGSVSQQDSPTVLGSFSNADSTGSFSYANHSAILTETGVVYTIGYNQYGQQGTGSTGGPDATLNILSFPNSATISAVDVGAWHTLAIDATTGSLYGWGDNYYYQLTDDHPVAVTTPVAITITGANLPLLDIAAGDRHSLVVDSDNRVWVWGNEEHCRLGFGGTCDDTAQRSPIRLADFGTVVEVDAAAWVQMALLSNGDIWTWGEYEVTGQGGTGEVNTPTKLTVSGNPTFVSMAAGSYAAFAVTDDGTLWGWGDATDGLLCDGLSTGVFTSPKVITAFTGATDVRVGFSHTLVITDTPDCPGTPDCSGASGGTCDEITGVCTCESGRYGSDCAGVCDCNTSPCNDGAVGDGTCNCVTGWSGSDCATPVCTVACGDNGDCTAPDTCTCDSGWTTGPSGACDTPDCGGFCGAHGTCVAAPNTCTCDEGWATNDCSVECPGGESNQCSGNGSCDDGAQNDGTCVCTAGFSGLDCSTPCPVECPNSCLANGTCSNCSPGYYGAGCANECPGGAATPCSDNGLCAEGTGGSGQCTCQPGYYTSACAFECPGGADSPCSDNGVCADGASGPGICTCYSGFKGLACEAECPGGANNQCNGNGVCQDDASCVCNEGFAGDACQVVCPGGEGNVCNGRGTCDSSTAECSCDFGAWGNACELDCPSCFGNVTCAQDTGACPIDELEDGSEDEGSEPLIPLWGYAVGGAAVAAILLGGFSMLGTSSDAANSALGMASTKKSTGSSVGNSTAAPFRAAPSEASMSMGQRFVGSPSTPVANPPMRKQSSVSNKKMKKQPSFSGSSTGKKSFGSKGSSKGRQGSPMRVGAPLVGVGADGKPLPQYNKNLDYSIPEDFNYAPKSTPLPVPNQVYDRTTVLLSSAPTQVETAMPLGGGARRKSSTNGRKNSTNGRKNSTGGRKNSATGRRRSTQRSPRRGDGSSPMRRRSTTGSKKRNQSRSPGKQRR